MAWYDRFISAVNSGVRSVARWASGAQPEPTFPETQPAYTPSADELFPEYVEADPTSLPSYEGNYPVTIYDEFSEPHTQPMDTWLEDIVELSAPEMLEKYGYLDNLDVIRALEDADYWTDDDWEWWREAYGEAHGG